MVAASAVEATARGLPLRWDFRTLVGLSAAAALTAAPLAGIASNDQLEPGKC